MKLLGLIFVIALLTSCDPFEFGYKKNPAYILDETLKSIENMDLDTFSELTGKEALCIYNNEEGLTHLKKNLDIQFSDINLNAKIVETRHFSAPVFVGYWSYYHERYQIEISKKSQDEVILDVVVDCEFGTDDESNPRFINLKPSKYERKECKLVKIEPKSFEGLKLNPNCGLLMISL